ncbi:glucokinase [Mortierella sp. AD032]|nr:glucokinase [Mortierella sp. AD032]
MLSTIATTNPPGLQVTGGEEGENCTDPTRDLVTKSHPRPSRCPIARSEIVYESERQQKAVASLVQEFTIQPTKLKAIKNRFISEMTKGLAKQGETLAMVQTHILGRLDGSETGTYLTLDIGGTYLRVVLVELSQGSKIITRQKKYAIDPLLKLGEPKLLFDFMASCIDSFLLENDTAIPKEGPLELGFTFSFPVLQTGINSGTLIDWTKGFSCHGMVGKDPAEFLQQALLSRNLSVNPLCGLGTGSNAAYIERVDRIVKRDFAIFGDNAVASAKEMIINIEFGAFDNERQVLPLTMYDNKVDRKSLNPSKQLFEKMVAGMYLGEITRNVLLDLIDNRLLFRSQSSRKLDTPWEFLTKYMSVIEEDATPDLENVRRVLEDNLALGLVEPQETNVAVDVKPYAIVVEASTQITTAESSPREPTTTLSDRQIVKLVVELVGQRSARLAAVALGAILEHTMGCTWARDEAEREEGVDIGVDGSLYGFYPGFERDLVCGLEELFAQEPGMSFLCKKNRVRLGRCLDGSSVGAALGALLSTSDRLPETKH